MPLRDTMGLDFGLQRSDLKFKKKYYWMLFIDEICASSNVGGVNVLPPSKAARPSISFKEMEAQHLNETIYFPGKPDWKPITLTLYEPVTNDTKTSVHPVFTWLRRAYDPQHGGWRPSIGTTGFEINNIKQPGFKINRASLELYDGCGFVLEQWVFESVWPQAIEFGDLDMGANEIVTCDITLRYDRAYIETNRPPVRKEKLEPPSEIEAEFRILLAS